MKRKPYKKITKKEFYKLDGFKNSNLFRKADKNGKWKYYMVLDNE